MLGIDAPDFDFASRCTRNNIIVRRSCAQKSSTHTHPQFTNIAPHLCVVASSSCEEHLNTSTNVMRA